MEKESVGFLEELEGVMTYEHSWAMANQSVTSGTGMNTDAGMPMPSYAYRELESVDES